MRDLIVLYNKNLYFSMNGEIDLQTDVVAMGFLLGPVLAAIFMVVLNDVYFYNLVIVF